MRPTRGIQRWTFVALLIAATFMGMVYRGVTTFLPKFLALEYANGAGVGTAVGGALTTAALVVGLATSNSFMLPTHQVNALYMGPGRYRSVDFMKAGGILTVIFIVVVAVGLGVHPQHIHVLVRKDRGNIPQQALAVRGQHKQIHRTPFYVATDLQTTQLEQGVGHA